MGPVDYLRKQNSMMPPNLAAAAQRNLTTGWQQTNNVNFANRKVAASPFNFSGKSFGATQSPVVSAMNQSSAQTEPQPTTFSLTLGGTPETSIGTPLPQLNTTVQGQQTPSSASASTNGSQGSDWRFQDFHDMYGAHNATQAVLSPQATANFQRQYGWGGVTS